jgi:CheY-like chemotaxis protein
MVDREQLEQVLINLTANARDAMPDGGELTFAVRNITLGDSESCSVECPPAGAYVAVSATDTGVGMTSEVRDRAFERFFTTKAEGLGTGLGLAAARRFATECGGCIAVRSAPGQGTTLVLYLPRASPPALRVEHAGRDTPLPRGAETVLVADDEQQVRSAVHAVLEQLGYRVREAATGGQALEVATDASIDLLLADVAMPGLGGVQLWERLREKGAAPRVLFMSGHPSQVTNRYGLADGAPLLRKAFSPAELARRVRDALDTPPFDGAYANGFR